MAAIPTILFLPLIFPPPLLLPQQSLANIALGSIISTNDSNPSSWNSTSGEFAFGFRQIYNTTGLFMLAIWFTNIPDEQTITWNAHDSNGILIEAPSGSSVSLTAWGLRLTNPQGDTLWNAEQSQQNVNNAAMLDTGNFVLESSDSSYLWQTFQYPTDTLLPSQTLNLTSTLFSRFSQTNYTKGRFELYFDNITLSLSAIGWPSDSRYPSYFNVDSKYNASDSASQLVFNETGDIYVETKGGNKIYLGWTNNTDFDTRNYYYRATLDYYGAFTQYSRPKASNNNQGWSIVRYVPQNPCENIYNDEAWGSGCCGYNSYCSMKNDMPTCECPEGFSLVDPNNQFGGCQLNFSLGCGADDAISKEDPQKVYELKTLQSVNWPFGDYERLEGFSQSDCKQSCLLDCNCAAVVTNVLDQCWKKRFPLSNGRLVSDETTGMTVTFIKTRIQPLNVSIDSDSDPTTGNSCAILGSLIGSLVLNTLLLATGILILLLKKRKINVQVSNNLLETNMHSFTYEALKEETLGFSEELGRGSFGIVYKGTLKSGTNYNNNNIVAVKRLDRLAQEREKEFRAELSAIGKTCHKNLVRLIGFCDEGIHRLLVYEFMPNGTLAQFIFGETKPTWVSRVGLALGIARGLLYLHEECDTPIIHCDIKPQNILINECFGAKISDFGLAKLLMSNQSRTETMIRGTRGYVAPEWFKNVPVTAKVDVYSFGVMLLEIICCRKSVVMDIERGQEVKEILTDWAYDCYVEGRLDMLVENDMEAMEDKGRLKKWVMIAMWCIQERHEVRPTIKTVMLMLEGFLDVPNPPLPSSFISSA